MSVDDISMNPQPKPSQSSTNESNQPKSDVAPSPIQERDIFQAKTTEEIERNYNELLVTYGKWNANMYLEIHKELNKDKSDSSPSFPPGFNENNKEAKCFESSKVRVNQKVGSTELKNGFFYEICYEKGDKPSYPPLIEDIPPQEPAYKRIFKIAKMRRRVKREPAIAQFLELEKSRTVQKVISRKIVPEPIEEPSVQIIKCKLMEDSNNNFVRDIREKKAPPRARHSRDTFKEEPELDTIGKLFAQIPIDVVVKDHLFDVVDLIRVNIGEKIPITADEGTKDLADLNSILIETEKPNIEEIKEKLLDARWRRKFDLDKIEISEEENSTDHSEIYVSESSSLCTGDSLDTSVDFKARRPGPSRIPYIDEIHRKKDALFDKIALKWEKVVMKNLIEPNLAMTPIFRRLYNDIRVRSGNQFYEKILKSLDAKYESVYPKTFETYKHRMQTKLGMTDRMNDEKKRLKNEQRLFESYGITGKPDAKRKTFDYTTTKCRTANQRKRLNYIMKETALRDLKGLTNWTKDGLANDFVNLRPIIATKQPVEGKPRKNASKTRTGILPLEEKELVKVLFSDSISGSIQILAEN